MIILLFTYSVIQLLNKSTTPNSVLLLTFTVVETLICVANVPHVQLSNSDVLLFPDQADKSSAVAVSAIRNWWNTYQLDKSDTNDSNTDQDEDELAGRKHCKLFIT